MGYMRHNAIVVTSWNADAIKEAHAKATELEMAVSEIVASPMNGYASFFVAPDGSKEGWADSDLGDVAREVFVRWLDGSRYSDGSTNVNWVEVQYGDEEYDTRVVNDSDARARAEEPESPDAV